MSEPRCSATPTVAFHSPALVDTLGCSGRMPMVLAAMFGRLYSSFDQVHLRRADEAGDEEVPRRLVELQRRADLLDIARR